MSLNLALDGRMTVAGAGAGFAGARGLAQAGAATVSDGGAGGRAAAAPAVMRH